MTFFQYLRRLASGIKAKDCGNSYRSVKFARRVAKTEQTDIQRILVFGDSNSILSEGSNGPWPKLLEDKDPLRYNIFNESCDGRTTRYDIGGRNGVSVISKKLAENAPLDYVLIMLGTNDVKRKYGPPSAAEIVDGMRNIIDLVETHGYGARPILLTPPPLGSEIIGELANAKHRISPVVDEYRLLVVNRNIRLIDVFSILEINTDFENDMVHLNAFGRQKIAEAVLSELQGENTYNEQTDTSEK